MRIIICGDTHIGAVFGLGGGNGKGGNTRVDDYKKTLNDMIDYAISTKADVFVQTGDVFDTRNPEPEYIDIINRCIRRLSGAGITSVWIMGNHDYKRAGDSFTSAITSLAARDYPNTRIVLEPEVIKVIADEKINLLLMPFRDRRMYGGKTCEEDSAKYEEEVRQLLNKCDSDSSTVAIGHNFFYEGSYNHYGGAEVMSKVSAFEKCDAVIMGHNHQFKVFKKENPVAFYIGSMEKLNFGDSDVDKYFADYDTNSKKVTIIKSKSRRLIDECINLEKVEYSNIYNRIEEFVSNIDIKDSIIRVKISIKDTLASSVKRIDVQNILYKHGAFYVSKILIDPVHNRINKDSEILKEKSDIKMFEAFLKKQDLNDDLKSKILKEARMVIK